MTYSTSRKADARIPVTVVELYLDTCANVYGSAPCTASGAVGSECYNTFGTCQDTANFVKGEKTYRFYQAVSNWPKGIVGYECLKKEPQFTSCEIDPKGSLGKRGAVKVDLIDFADDDLYTDPYASTRPYNAETQGTFFGKLKIRSEFYKGRLMKVRKGYINKPFSFNDFEDRLYVIDSMDYDQLGRVTIKGKDLLKLTDDKTAIAPAPNTGTLSADIDNATLSIVLQTGEGADYDASGYVRVGDEVIPYSSITTDTINATSRGYKSVADDHSIDDSVQQCLSFASVNVVDIIHSLLVNYTDITENYIPYDAGLTVPTLVPDEWDVEKESWLSGNDMTHMITEPTGISKILGRLCKQNLIYMWFNEKEQEVKLRAIAPELKNIAPIALNDTQHIIKDSITVKDNDKERISQLHVYYDIKHVTGDVEDSANYSKRKITVDTVSENVNANAEKAIKVVYADWLGAADTGLILTLSGRLLSRYAGKPQTTKFKIDNKDADFWTGGINTIDSSAFQGADGSNLIRKMQILKAIDTHDKQITELTAETWDYEVLRYGFIAPDIMGDYTVESVSNQNDYGFISDNLGKYTNGDSAHLIA